LKPSVVTVVVLLAGAALLGCSGSSSGSSPAGGGTAGEASKSIAIEAISSKLASFDGSDQEAETQRLLEFVRGRTEFTESGMEDGAVWARFPDGTTLIIGNNLVATRPNRVASAAPVLWKLAMGVGPPETRNVLLGGSLGSTYQGFTEELAGIFEQGGYARVQPDSTVDALKSLDHVAVLYLNAHGATVPLRSGGASEYAVWTSTRRAADGSTDTPYLADLLDGSLTYYQAHVYTDDATVPGGVRRSVETHYAITSKFVRKYWTGKFAAQSLVFINACKSSSAEAFDFQMACLTAGAGVHLGWTDRVQGGDAVVSASFLFDRMIGSNWPTVLPEMPPQRPFPLLEVWDEMRGRQRPNQAYDLASSVNPGTRDTASLFPFMQDGEFGLAPSIRDLAVHEQADELSVNGWFGDVPGIVTVGNKEVTVKSWTSWGIVCDLPRSGEGSTGDVRVIVGDAHSSNPVPLTAWHGTSTYTEEGRGTLKMTMTFDFRIRGDVHGYRAAPGEVPCGPGMSFDPSLANSGTYEFSGIYVDIPSQYTEEWSGSGTMTAFTDAMGNGSQPLASNVYALGVIDQGRWSMNVLATAIQGKHVHAVQRDPNGSGQVLSDFWYDEDGLGVGDFDGTGPPYQSDFTSDFVIQPGNRSLAGPRSLTLQWSAFAPENAPGSDTQR